MVVEDLNRMPPDLMAELRTMSPAQRRMHFWRLVSPENRAFTDRFLAEVVDGGVAAEDWARGRIVVPDFPTSRLLGITVDQILAPILAVGEVVRLRVGFAGSVRRPHPYGGAPAVVKEEASYLWSPPDGATGIALGMVELVPVTRPEVAVRRWMAYRAECHGELPADLSRDGRHALEALTREIHEFGNEGTPGFRGPDEWFE